MAGGFRSPLPVLGTSGPEVTTTGGYITLPWWQAGGSSGAVQGGYHTLPWWQAGGGVGEQVNGGHRPKTQQERKKERVLAKRKRDLLKSIEFLKSKISLTDVSPKVKEVLETGKIVLENTEVNVGFAPTLPVLLATPVTDGPTEGQEADLIRIEALTTYKIQLINYQEELVKFEEEFLLFLILMTDEL
jgi:hypothetical protein